jgi:hypothetical protein
LLWLLEVIFQAAGNWNSIAQRSETLLGAILVFTLGVVVPLGSPLAAVFILYLHRRALYIGALLPLLPLAYLTWEKAQRIGGKFHEYRAQGAVSSFGAAVIETVIVLGLWVVAWVHVLYIRRALNELAAADSWSAAPAPARPAAAESAGGVSADDFAPDDEVCFLLPDTVADEERD